MYPTVVHLDDVSGDLQIQGQMQDLSQYDHIAFTSRNGIHAVMQRLEGLHGSSQAALQALHDSQVHCWALHDSLMSYDQKPVMALLITA